MTKVGTILLFSAAFFAANAQQKSGETGWALSPMLLKDAACARDYANALAVGGVEGRKRLNEIVLLDCGKPTMGLYRGASLEKVQLPGTKATADHVSMVCATTVHCSQTLLRGWIVEFRPASDAEIQKKVAALAGQMKVD